MLQNGCSLLPGRMRAFRSAARSARTSCRWSTCWSCSPAGTRTGSTCTSPRGTTRGTPEIEFDKSLHLSPRDSGFGPTRGPPAAQESQNIGRVRPVSALGPPAPEFEPPSEHTKKSCQVCNYGLGQRVELCEFCGGELGINSGALLFFTPLISPFKTA